MQALDTIKREAAGGGAGGELFTIVDKQKGGKKANDKSEDDISQMYAMPDKSKKKQNRDQGVCRHLHYTYYNETYINSDHLWATKRWKWSLFIEIKIKGTSTIET